MPARDVSGFEGVKQLGQMAAKEMSVTSISGVGDDAYYLAVGDQVDLIVKKGNVAFKVAVYAHIPVESKKAKEKTLSRPASGGGALTIKRRIWLRPLITSQLRP